MPRLENWRWDGTIGIAGVGGMRLWVDAGCNPVSWGIIAAQGDVGAGAVVADVIDTGGLGDADTVDKNHKAWLSARTSAQDAAEAEAARLLADDAGVRALLATLEPRDEGCPNCAGTGWGHPDDPGGECHFCHGRGMLTARDFTAYVLAELREVERERDELRAMLPAQPKVQWGGGAPRKADPERVVAELVYASPEYMDKVLGRARSVEITKRVLTAIGRDHLLLAGPVTCDKLVAEVAEGEKSLRGMRDDMWAARRERDMATDRANVAEYERDLLRDRVAELEARWAVVPVKAEGTPLAEIIERAKRCEAAEARVAALEEAARWIPVGERLPDFGQCVIVPNPMSGKIPFKEVPLYVERYYNRPLRIWLDLDGRTVPPPECWRPLPAVPKATPGAPEVKE